MGNDKKDLHRHPVSPDILDEPEDDDYDRSLEYRQLARFVIIAGLLMFTAGIFIYVLFFVD